MGLGNLIISCVRWAIWYTNIEIESGKCIVADLWFVLIYTGGQDKYLLLSRLLFFIVTISDMICEMCVSNFDANINS